MLLALLLVLPAANNRCTFPSSPGVRLTGDELARVARARQERIELVQDCAADDVVWLGEVVRAVIGNLPSLSFDPLWVVLPHASGLEASVNLYLGGGIERRDLEVGQYATVSVDGALGVPGPRIACWFTIERTETGYRIFEAGYRCFDGSCEVLAMDDLEMTIVDDALPVLLATGGADIEIGPMDSYAARGRVEFDGAGGGTITARVGTTEVEVAFDFGS